MEEYFKEFKTLKEILDWCEWFLSSQGFCVICGHDDPLDLEDDHVGAKANSPIIISLCRNCHGRKSKIQRRSWPDGWCKKDNPVQAKQALVIRGISDLLRLKSDQMLLGDNGA